MEILIIEDEQIIANGIAHILTLNGYNVHIANTLTQATDILSQQSIQLALLDMMLPDGSGLTFAQETLLLDYPNCKIMFLTAVDDEQTIIDCFNLGSEDYITKPFRLPIVLARVQAVIKRYQLDTPQATTFAHLTIDTVQQLLFIQDTAIHLTAQEQKLFFYFLENKGRILTREQILAFLWDNHNLFVNDNTLTVTIKRLRQKIEQDTPLIETIRGVGYRLVTLN